MKASSRIPGRSPEAARLPRWSWSHLALAAALAALPAGARGQETAAAPPARPALAPCTGARAPEGALCGTVEVWEDRAARRGRRIPLRVMVLPATGPNPERAALVWLAGGPGQEALPSAAWIAGQFPGARRTRDLLLVDRRGTGGSNPLGCNYYGHPDSVRAHAGPFMPPDVVRACRQALERRAGLRLYTTAIAADDLDEVRAALGYERLDLFGTSYGSRAALEYMRGHPGRVRAVVLQGVIAPGEVMPANFARHAQTALEGVIGECLEQPGCAAAFPRLRQEAREVAERLARAPVPVRVRRPISGEETRIPFTRDLFGEAVRFLLYSPDRAALVPVLVHRAAEGDYGPLAEFALYGRRGILVGGVAQGLYLSVTCAEDLPFVDTAAAAREAAGTVLGAYRVREQAAACRQWPRGAVDPAFHTPVSSSAPVLLVSGERDPVTPPAGAERAARTLSNSLHLVVPSGGHGYHGLRGSECVAGVMDAFVSAGTLTGLDTSCIARIRRPPFPLRAPPTRPDDT